MPRKMRIWSDNDPTDIVDYHFSMVCPHCGVHSNLTAVSIPRYELITRFQLTTVGIGYRCDNCNEPVFLRFPSLMYSGLPQSAQGKMYIWIYPEYEIVERPSENFEMQYLPEAVANDFKEALACYSNACYNAFAAMCRRCIQSSFTHLGATAKDSVKRQLDEVRKAAEIDDETYQILDAIILSGHDGAHPNLPELSEDRAVVLLELMKDVLYQLFVRKAKLQEVQNLRKQAIAKRKDSTE